MIFRRIIYFILIYAVLVYNVLYRTYDGFMMLVFTGTVSLLSFGMLVLSRLTLRCHFAEETVYVSRGQEYELRYYLRNRLPFPVTRADIIPDGIKKPQSFCISAGNVAIVTKKDCKEHCGCYYIGAGSIRLYDFFRISGFRIKNTGVAKVVALPRLFDVDAIGYIAGMLHLEREKAAGALRNTGEVKEIREYQDGDRIKDIHHKLSSRMSQLMVKEYDAEEESDDSFIFYGQGASDAAARDGMLELMYNIMYLRLKKRGRATGYVLNAGNAEQFFVDSGELLDLFFERIFDASGEEITGAYELPQGAHVFAASFTPELCALCSQAHDRGQNIVLYLPDTESGMEYEPDIEVVYVSAGGGAA